MFQTVYRLEALTDSAQEWMNEHIQAEPWQMIGKAIGVEHRYIEAIVEGMTEGGLVLGEDFIVD